MMSRSITKRHWNSDLLLVCGGALFSLLVLWFVNGVPAVQTILALPLVFLLPGYALAMALFPQHKTAVPERLLLSVGFSLASIVISGLLLNLSPWGLQTHSWLVVLVGLTLVSSSIAWWRREPSYYEVVTEAKRPFRFTLPWQPILLLSLAIVITIMAVQIAQLPSPSDGLEGYTQLWVEPASEDNRLTIVFESKELEETTYQLDAKIGDFIIYQSKAITLSAGQSWTAVFPRPSNQPFTATLHRLDSPDEEPYREVVWWPSSTE